MSKSKTVSLKGAAAGAFINMAMQKPSASEDETLERVATLVYMHMKDNDMAEAVKVLKNLKCHTRK